MTQPIHIHENERGNIETSFNYIMKFNFNKASKILDIGCNYASLGYNLWLQGYKNTYNIEIQDNINIGKRKYKEIADKIFKFNGDVLPFEDNYFDIITMFDVIEHVPEIDKFLFEQVNRVLKPDGIFIFQTPNKIINIPWEMILKKSFTKWKIDHCSLQTLWSLKNLLKNSGFKDLQIEKNNILTEHNKNKVKEKLSYLGIFLLHFLNKFPLLLTSNFWGICKKRTK